MLRFTATMIMASFIVSCDCDEPCERDAFDNDHPRSNIIPLDSTSTIAFNIVEFTPNDLEGCRPRLAVVRLFVTVDYWRVEADTMIWMIEGHEKPLYFPTSLRPT